MHGGKTTIAAMNVDDAVASLPAASPFRKILRGLFLADEDKREKHIDAIDKQQARKIGKREAVALLRAATELTFLPQEFDWVEPKHDLIFVLVHSPHPELVKIARDAYPRLKPREQCAVLALFGACATRDAAKAFMHCVREHGWPRCYGRVFTEAAKLYPYADVMFPELVERAGKNLAGVTDLLIDGLASGQIDAKRVNLEPLAPLVTKSLKTALAKAAKHQRAKGTAWRFTERYFEPRRMAGAWLDIAGHLRAKSLDALLRKGLAMRDPLLVLFAATSLVRRGGKVPAERLEMIAACHETRSMLFTKLEELDALKLFPAAWRTWDAFAAAEMVTWLLYPSELGHEPDEIEQMHVVTHGARALYIWRFRDGRKWFAGVSGPFTRRGAPAPQHGEMTFSRFDPWSSATAEEHAVAVMKTLQSWAKTSGRA